MLLLAAGCGARGRSTNLVVVSLDTTRADHLGPYGDAAARTPNLDALASAGFVFRRHLTPVPITLPAHTTLFTGLYPPTHGVHDNGSFVVSPDQTTLAEVLHDAGYETSAFVGAFPLAARFGLDQGFDRYDDRFARDEPERRRGALDIFFDERPANAVVDAAIRYHSERRRKPFFTFLHFFDPHQPQQPPAPYDVLFRNRLYDGEIAFVDEQLGRLFAFLKERGEWDDTLVVVTADHGEGLGEHGESSHSILLHQATLHIPLIVAGPRVPRGSSQAWTSSTQVFATLLDLLGVKAPRGASPTGASLRPLLESGGRLPPGAPPFTAYFETIAPLTSQGWSHMVGYMRGDVRMIHAPRPELYDLGGDPRELTNLAPDDPARVAELRAELRRFLNRYQTASVAEKRHVLDAETKERLAALGYIQTQDLLGDLRDLYELQPRLDPKDRVFDISTFSDAKAAMAMSRWGLAEALWREVVRRSPENTYAYQGLAQVYGLTEQWEACLAQLDEALRKNPEADHLRRLRGEIQVQLQRFDQGLADLRAVPGDSIEATTWLGKAYQGLGRSKEAKEQWRKGLALAPGNRWLRLYLANQLASDGDYAEAETTYRALAADEPYFALAFYNYGRMLLERGQPERARPMLARAARLSPRHEGTQAAMRALAGSSP
jgi:arylsulfatase A-like enzyme/predicted negative regulator of RcsB-dependent stress response